MHLCHCCRFSCFDKFSPLIERIPSSNGDNLGWIIQAHNTEAASRTFRCRMDFLCNCCPRGDKGIFILCSYPPTINNSNHRLGPSRLAHTDVWGGIPAADRRTSYPPYGVSRRIFSLAAAWRVTERRCAGNAAYLSCLADSVAAEFEGDFNDCCPYRKLDPAILMLEFTKHRPSFETPVALNGPSIGRILP